MVNYGINSNTSAFGFLKCTLKKKKKLKEKKGKSEEQNQQKIEKNDDGDSDSDEVVGVIDLKVEEFLSPFKELVNSNIANYFKQLNKQIVPLSFVGQMLNFVGNHLLFYIWQIQQRKVFYPKHKALSIQLMGNGVINTKV